VCLLARTSPALARSLARSLFHQRCEDGLKLRMNRGLKLRMNRGLKLRMNRGRVRRSAAGSRVVFLVAAIGGLAACLQVDPIIEGVGGHAVDAGRGPADDPTCCEEPSERPPSSVGASCRRVVPALSRFASVAPRKSACSALEIDAITDVCSLRDMEETPACKAARALHATCADCIFSTTTDALDKVATITPGELFAYRANIHTCIDHVSGIEGCGSAYLNGYRCTDSVCRSTDNADCRGLGSYEQCTTSAGFGLCVFPSAPGCHESAVSGPCLRADRDKEFFTLVIEASCGKINDAGINDGN
jgi:hypothetical protein